MSKRRRVALVTGGSKRVGAAIVQTLADAAFDVLFTTRTLPRIKPTSKHAKITHITIDVTDLPNAANRLLARVQQTCGRLDLLVHNASIFEPGNLQRTSLSQIRRMNRIHVEVPIMLTRSFAPLLRESHGHVIMMLDAGIDRPWPSYLAYISSKAAMASLTISLARALAPQVTVNGIAPGVVEWPDDMPAAERERFLSRVPLRRAGTPADVANLIKYLVTDGRYITGQIIRVDGGRSIV